MQAQAFQLFIHVADIGGDLRALLAVQRIDVIFGHFLKLAVHQLHRHEAVLIILRNQFQIQLFAFLVQIHQRLLLHVAGLLADQLNAVVVSFRRKAPLQLLENNLPGLMQRCLKLRRLSGRQLQGQRLARMLEIIDIDPVIRGLHIFGMLLQQALNHGALAQACRADCKNVVAGIRQRNAGFNRSAGAVLA